MIDSGGGLEKTAGRRASHYVYAPLGVPNRGIHNRRVHSQGDSGQGAISQRLAYLNLWLSSTSGVGGKGVSHRRVVSDDVHMRLCARLFSNEAQDSE